MKSAVGTGGQLVTAGKEENLKSLTIQILKTMILVGKPYGQGYLINLLTGKKDAILRDINHSKLETYGSQPAYLGNRLACAMHYLVDLGLVETNAPACNTLKISEAGKAWLDQPYDLMVRASRLRFTKLEMYMRTALRIHRSAVSRQTSIEPWAIFTDYSLDRVVLAKPLSLDHLCHVPGFNTSKCEKFGVGIIHAVQDVIENHEAYKRAAMIQAAKGHGYQTVKKMFSDNFTLPEIAQTAGLKLETVVSYLCDLHEIGQVDAVPWIEKNISSKSLFKGVEYFARVERPTLKEGHVTLGLDYTILKFARLIHHDNVAREEEKRILALEQERRLTA